MTYQTKFLMYLYICLLFIGGCKKKHDLTQFQALSKDSFALVFLSSLEGYVVPCGCTSNPLGGIDRFAQVFQDIKTATNNRLALIDTGNLLFETASRHDADLCQDNARLELLLSTLNELGLKQTLIGKFDDARGSAYRQGWYQKYGLSTLSSRPFTLINAGDYDLALIAIPVGFVPQSLQEQLRKIRLQKKVKAVIGVSELSLDDTKKNLGGINGLDIIIQAEGSSSVVPPPKRLGPKGPILIEGARQGQYATVLILQNLSDRQSQMLELDDRAFLRGEQLELLTSRLGALKAQKISAPSSRQEFLSHRISLAEQELLKLGQQKKEPIKPLAAPNLVYHAIGLTKQIDPLPTVKAKLEAYERSIPALVAQCEAKIQCPPPLPGEATYVGAQTCKRCHQQAYEVWQKAVFIGVGQDESGQQIQRQIGHSKAWATLVAAGKDRDRNCVGCHSVGFMKPGGYCKTSEVKFRKDVQCESCHGPGSLHAQGGGNKQYINRQVSEQSCRTCHHTPHIQSFESFNYDQQVVKILGPGHGERLLKELQHKRGT